MSHPASMANENKLVEPKEFNSRGHLAMEESPIISSSDSSINSEGSGGVPDLHLKQNSPRPSPRVVQGHQQCFMVTTAGPSSSDERSDGNRAETKEENWPLRDIEEPGINDVLVGRGGAF